MQAEPNIIWPQLTKFVSQLNHDLRNHLNAVELQAAFLNEIVTDPEAKREVERLRQMTGDLCRHLQHLSGSLAQIRPIPLRYRATDFVEDLRTKLAREQPEMAPEIDWQSSLGEEEVEIDPQLLEEAFLELFRNAAMHGRGKGVLGFQTRGTNGAVEFVLREPKTQFEDKTEDWGNRPLGKIRSGHYGLGLFRARGIFEAHHGIFRAQFDPAAAALTTIVALPLAS